MRPTPKPRDCVYYGMRCFPTIIGETWLEPEEFCYPAGGMTRRVRALCPDGKLRVFRCGVPDTFFTIPARGGFITSDEHGFEFTPSK